MPAFTPHLNLELPGGGSLGIGGDDETADVDKLNQNFQKLDTWADATDDRLDEVVGQGYFVGTNAERLVMAPPKLRDGIKFKVTDNQTEWDRYKGKWRRISGRQTFSAKAWATVVGGASPMVGRTEILTIPYPVDEKETVQVSTEALSGFGFVSVNSTTRNENDTEISMRFMQILSVAISSFTISWRIIPGNE